MESDIMKELVEFLPYSAEYVNLTTKAIPLASYMDWKCDNPINDQN